MNRKRILILMGILALAILSFGLVVSFSASKDENRLTLKEAVMESFREKPEETPVISASASPGPEAEDITETPVPETPAPTAEPPKETASPPVSSPLVTPISLPTLKPVETSAPEETQSYGTVHTASVPELSIENVVYPPKTMVENNVADLKGMIKTSCGVICYVEAQLLSGGNISQRCIYYPNESAFSLAGTVNAELHFAHLTPGSYTYKIVARAVNEGLESEKTLVSYDFEVTKRKGESYIADNGEDSIYSAKKTSDTDNAGIIWNYLIDKFGNPCAAAGIMANIKAESSYNPNAGNGNFSSINSYGLCQWTNERKTALKTFADEKGSSAYDLNTQLDFLMHELDTSYPQLKTYLQSATSGYNAAIEFCIKYEQSASTGSRGSSAKEILEKYAR